MTQGGECSITLHSAGNTGRLEFARTKDVKEVRDHVVLDGITSLNIRKMFIIL